MLIARSLQMFNLILLLQNTLNAFKTSCTTHSQVLRSHHSPDHIRRCITHTRILWRLSQDRGPLVCPPAPSEVLLLFKLARLPRSELVVVDHLLEEPVDLHPGQPLDVGPLRELVVVRNLSLPSHSSATPRATLITYPHTTLHMRGRAMATQIQGFTVLSPLIVPVC